MSIEQEKQDLNKENGQASETNMDERGQKDIISDQNGPATSDEEHPDMDGEHEPGEDLIEEAEDVEGEPEKSERADNADLDLSDSEAEKEEGEAELKARSKTKRKKKSAKEPEPQKNVSIIHLVFDEPGAEQIRQSFELEPEITGEIVYIADNYSLGPVADLGESEGWQARKQWWQSVLGLSEEEQPEVMTADKMKLHQLLQNLEEDEDSVLWIWMGQNERDVAGYFHVISQLMEFQGRILVLYLNNLPFIDDKGHIFYPRQLAEILPKEFVKASRLARVVTLSEFELDPEEWDKLSRQPGSVRLLEGGKKLNVKENDYYDKMILDQLGTATMKLSRLLSLLATKAKLGLPEYYILWRVKALIESGQILSQGDFDKGGKNISLKATQGQMFVELNPEEANEQPEDEPGN